jgi:hypothetical protein
VDKNIAKKTNDSIKESSKEEDQSDRKLESLLEELFATKEGVSREFQCKIPTETGKIVAEPPIVIAQALENKIDKAIKDLLKKSILGRPTQNGPIKSDQWKKKMVR